MIDCFGKDRSDLVQVAAGIEEAIHLGPIPGPFLDLVEVELVGLERIVGLFSGVAFGPVYRSPTIHARALQDTPWLKRQADVAKIGKAGR